MVNGEDWDEEDIGRKFANSPTVQSNYTVFNTGLENLKPSFGEGIKILSRALKILKKIASSNGVCVCKPTAKSIYTRNFECPMEIFVQQETTWF